MFLTRVTPLDSCPRDVFVSPPVFPLYHQFFVEIFGNSSQPNSTASSGINACLGFRPTILHALLVGGNSAGIPPRTPLVPLAYRSLFGHLYAVWLHVSFSVAFYKPPRQIPPLLPLIERCERVVPCTRTYFL